MLVGLGSCAFTLISAYGFDYVLDPGVTLDPSRIAAQIVSASASSAPASSRGAEIPSVDRNRVLHITYADGQGVLRQLLEVATTMGFSSSILRTRRTGEEQKPMVSMDVRFFGHHPLRNLVPHLMDLHGVVSVIVRGADSNEDDDDAA